jgi:hypothetical protein
LTPTVSRQLRGHRTIQRPILKRNDDIKRCFHLLPPPDMVYIADDCLCAQIEVSKASFAPKNLQRSITEAADALQAASSQRVANPAIAQKCPITDPAFARDLAFLDLVTAKWMSAAAERGRSSNHMGYVLRLLSPASRNRRGVAALCPLSADPASAPPECEFLLRARAKALNHYPRKPVPWRKLGPQHRRGGVTLVTGGTL